MKSDWPDGHSTMERTEEIQRESFGITMPVESGTLNGHRIRATRFALLSVIPIWNRTRRKPESALFCSA